MKKLIQNILIPFSLFACAAFIVGCDSNMNAASSQDEEKSDVAMQKETKNNDEETHDQSDTSENAEKTELKSGNFFYIASDVALMQAKAGGYVSELQKTQEQFQQALETKDPAQFETTAKHLYSQLTGFNQALNGLDLKTQEIEQIRQNLIKANSEALKSPYLNGEIDLSQIDPEKVKQQMGSIQSEMLKLAAMILAPEDKNNS